MSDARLYATDPAAWADKQADALRRRAANEVDWDNVAEEIAHLSRSDRREIESRLEVLCAHLLKMLSRSGEPSPSWLGSIRETRRKIAKLIEESPSLHDYPGTVLVEAYQEGREVAQIETGKLDLPLDCPWTVAEVLDPAFLPEPVQ